MSCRLCILLAAVSLMACPGPAPQPPDAGQNEPPDGGQQSPPDAGPQEPPDAGPQEPPDAGPLPLLRLEGPFALAPNVELPAGLRVGMLWFSGLDPTLPAGPRAAVSGPEVSAGTSSRWRLDLHADPPPAARAAFQSPGGGAGSYSVGTLVLYRDLNGDGALTVEPDGTSSDELLGGSAGAVPFDLELDALHTLVIWREGTLGPDEVGFAPGFNLVTIDRPFARPTRVPNSSEVSLRLTGEPRAQLMFCPPAFVAQPPEFACGQRVYRTPRVAAALMALEQFGVLAGVDVSAGPRRLLDARVTLNGVALIPDADGAYALLEPVPTIIRPGVNQLRVEAPELEPVAFEVVLPAAPTLHTPSAGTVMPTSSSVTVAWQSVLGATSYNASLFLDAGGEGVFETSTLSHLDLVTPATAGPATLSVAALAEGSVGRHVSLGTSSVMVPVQLVTP